MERPPRHLTLVVTDLLDKAVPDTQSRASELELLLARAERETVTDDHEELLFKLFAPAQAGHLSLPTAALTYLADTDQRTEGWWLRADPVYLQTDNARVIMLGNEYLNIDQEEATALGEILRPLFETVGMELDILHPKRWYLHLRENPGVVFHPFSEVLGRDIHAYLPDAKLWRSLLNETQMILHESGVNRARETRGEWPINSLWFWGGGKLPAGVQSHFVQVWSDEPLAIGLAKLTGTAHAALPSDAQEWLNLANTPGEHLVVMQRLEPDFDIQGRINVAGGRTPGATAERFNTQWAAPLYAALRERALKNLFLYIGHGSVFHINRSLLSRWWRQRRPLAFYR